MSHFMNYYFMLSVFIKTMQIIQLQLGALLQKPDESRYEQFLYLDTLSSLRS